MRLSRRVERFGLRDLCVCLAITGLSLVVGRVILVNYHVFVLLHDDPRNHRDVWPSWGFAGIGFVGTLLVSLTLLRLIPPRPRPRRLIRLPGFYPGLVLVAGIALAVGNALRERWQSGTTYPKVSLVEDTIIRLVGMGPNLALGVAGAWGLLWLGGTWRSEPSWIDRSGRILGLAWIGLGAALGAFG